MDGRCSSRFRTRKGPGSVCGGRRLQTLRGWTWFRNETTEEWVNLDQEFTNPRHCFAKGHEAWQIAPGSQSTRALKELPQSSWARIKPLALIRTTVSLRWQRSALHMPLHGRKVCSGVLRAQSSSLQLRSEEEDTPDEAPASGHNEQRQARSRSESNGDGVSQASCSAKSEGSSRCSFGDAA